MQKTWEGFLGIELALNSELIRYRCVHVIEVCEFVKYMAIADVSRQKIRNK